jgi:hypothetical protein
MQVTKSAVFRGVPSFFRACCWEASKQRYGLDYTHPGRELARAVRGLEPYDVEPDDWERDCDYLDFLVEEGERDRALAWFVEHYPRYPRCLALVPTRRRAKFIDGVFDLLGDN